MPFTERINNEEEWVEEKLVSMKNSVWGIFTEKVFI
jgi:hypothetical protein